MKAMSWTFIALAAVSAAGCSGSSLLSSGAVATTGALPPEAPGAQAPAPVPTTPVARAYQVGITSARAAKCGFFFDHAKLKANFLAAESQAGASSEDLAKIEKNYDISDATMAKVIAKEENYCTDEKTKFIKADLVRHLAGDYAPGAPHPRKQEEEGLISFGQAGSQADVSQKIFGP